MQPIGLALQKLLQSFTSEPDQALIFLKELWPRIAGPELAHRSEPVRIVAKTLQVSVPDAIWKRQLDELADLILQSINNFCGHTLISRVEILVAPQGRRGAAVRSRRRG